MKKYSNSKFILIADIISIIRISRFFKSKAFKELLESNELNLRLEKTIKILQRGTRSKLLRKFTTKIIKKYRNYKVNVGLEKNKEFYDNYYILHPNVFEDISEIVIDSYVKVVSTKYPYRGEKYSEYHICESWNSELIVGMILHVQDINYRYEDLEGIDCNNRSITINPRQLELASESEIDQYNLNKFEIEIEKDLMLFPIL